MLRCCLQPGARPPPRRQRNRQPPPCHLLTSGSLTDPAEHGLPHSSVMRKWEFSSTPCSSYCSISSAAGDGICLHPPRNAWKPGRESHSQLSQQRMGWCKRGLQTRAPPATHRPQPTGTTPVAGRLPAGLLRDVRIPLRTGIFKTHRILPTPRGSGTIAKETGAANSAFLLLCWMKHELKTGRRQTRGIRHGKMGNPQIPLLSEAPDQGGTAPSEAC